MNSERTKSFQLIESRRKRIAGTVDPSSVSSFEPLGIGGAGYIRKGFGNQLVRDSRTIARAFATVSSSEPLKIGGAGYIRKGFQGNQLVRDSRTIARAFATEKVRSSYIRKGFQGNQLVRDSRTIARAFATVSSSEPLKIGGAGYVRKGFQGNQLVRNSRTIARASATVSSSEPLGIGGVGYVRKGFGNQLVRDSRTIARAFATEKVRSSYIRKGFQGNQLVRDSRTLARAFSTEKVRSSYIRKGFQGNQLVRDSRTIARAFATEKVRWSLHNARLRRAKKQAFCVYYTRFGVCKRGDGKCLYIHDPEKVAVCTKFLRGSCSDPACRLTHKVIPERMSDCSYFLEGLCTNESCPYRHVNVNPKAPICEGFLQGYCADGDMCNKKHTYVCPEYTLTGKCSSSTCKLRHLKKTKQPTSASKESAGSKREGRYFAPTTAAADGECQGQSVCCPANVVGDKIAESGDDRADFISVDEMDLENQDGDKFLDHRGMVLLSRLPNGGPTDALESLLKPRFLLKRDVTSS